MASEDVIELGSSDDEAEPAIKKIKPLPNAMVHIPTKLPGVTIKPAKKSVSSIPKELAGKNVTVTKISKGNILANPYAVKHKTNGRPIQQKPLTSFPQILKKPVLQNVQSRPVIPQSLMKKINSQVVINKIPTKSSVIKHPIRIQSPRSINNLPPSITVTRTSGGQKRIAPTTVTSAVRKKQKMNNKPKKPIPTEVLTVDLDDDDVSTTSTSSPQWYLRPEEQTSLIQQENNEEPESASSKLIEITIEDSPVKPIKSKRTNEVGAEFTVTINDSPVKTALEKNNASGSDSEVRADNKVPHSKKKLEYPKETVSETIEIEISPDIIEPPIETEPISTQDSNQAIASANENIIEIEESPLKVDGEATSTPKKNDPKPQLEVPKAFKELEETDIELSEFHPVYRKFIKLCFQLEDSDDMKKIVEKKIKSYYRQVPKEYTESDEFIDMVAGKIMSMKAGPEKMYLYIKDIVDELNLQRKMAKSQALTGSTEKKAAVSETDKFLYSEEREYDSKRQRQIRKLEKTLKKLHRAIQKLEEQEVDFDDDEDSVYLLTESDNGSSSNKDSDKQLEKNPKALLQRYKERMVRVHAKFCQLTNTKMPSEPRVQIDARPGQPTGPAKRLEKWINKKVPIGTPLPFPDFHDVLRCVREANTEDKLGWNEADIMEEARDLFTRCGKKLQRRRQENEWRLAVSRISVDIDPADESNDLKKKLDDNKKLAAKKETDVFNKFADRQSQLKLEGEEIGDKEAEESPVEDDEEEEPNEESLENTEKRKERLRRLLQEKSKKGVHDPEKSETIDNASDSQTEDKQVKIDKEFNETKKQDSEKTVAPEKPKPQTTPSDKTQTMDENIEIIPIEAKDNGDKKPDAKKDPEVIQRKIDKEPASPVIISETMDVNASKTKDNHVPPNNDMTSDNDDKPQLISDDSSKLESDVDELHLLQKLHSGTEANTSTQGTSDSESPIAISDTLESSDNKKQSASDVISIENSSYSESEINTELLDTKTDKETDPLADRVVAEYVDENTEIECSNIGVKKKVVKNNNDEYNESIEDILLASTDEEIEIDKALKTGNDKECVNLNDDSLTIGDTVVEGVDKSQSNPTTDDSSPGKQDDVSSVESVAFVSTKSDSPALNMDVDCKDSDNIDQANVEHVSNAAQEQNIVESFNKKKFAHTIELKASLPEEIVGVTDQSKKISDCLKNKQLPEKVNVVDESTKSVEPETLQKQIQEHSNDSSSAEIESSSK